MQCHKHNICVLTDFDDMRAEEVLLPIRSKCLHRINVRILILNGTNSCPVHILLKDILPVIMLITQKNIQKHYLMTFAL